MSQIEKTYFGFKNFSNGNKLVVYQDPKINKRAYGVISFEKEGFGFFMESDIYAESYQVYKATKNRDMYLIMNIRHDKKSKKDSKFEHVFYLTDLLTHINDYFFNTEKGVKYLFKQGWDDNDVQTMYDYVIN